MIVTITRATQSSLTAADVERARLALFSPAPRQAGTAPIHPMPRHRRRREVPRESLNERTDRWLVWLVVLALPPALYRLWIYFN